jgi:hypothetical protein
MNSLKKNVPDKMMKLKKIDKRGLEFDSGIFKFS